jgi:monoterpene epsilon-lactone hydrolase
MPDMPSQAMQDAIETLRERQRASAGQVPPTVAPLAGLPPLLIQVGTADLLLSDAERLAAAATQAGVDVTLQVGQGLPHVYQLLLGPPEAAQATEQIGTFLRTRVR